MNRAELDRLDRDALIARAEAAGVAEVAAGPDGVAALPVWAKAEIVKVTAAARRIRRNVLFIGSVELLGTCFSEHASGNEFQLIVLRLFVSTLGRTE